MKFCSQSLSHKIIGCYINALINIVTDVIFSDWHGLFLIHVIKLFISPKRFKNYQKRSKKVTFEDSFWRHRNNTAEWIWLFKRIHYEISDTHWLIPLFVFKVKIYYMQTLCFTFIVDFSAACAICLYGSAVKMALCHTQSINSAIAMRVNFGLQIPLYYPKTLRKQRKVNFRLH